MMMHKRLNQSLLMVALTAVLATGCGRAPTTGVAFAQAAKPASPAIASAAKQPQSAAQPTRAFDQAATSAVPAAEAVTIDFLTYNTWGKPGLLGTDEKSRFQLLGPAIRPFGIVTLQETFTRHAKSMAAASQFPHQQRTKNGDLFHLNAGLFTLSRYPIVTTDFAKFKQAGDFDRFANKGVLFTRLNVPGIGEVDVYTTHYQSKQEEKYSKIRLHDNSVLDALVKKHAKGNPTILSGDFNMTPDSVEYKDLFARLNFRDAFAEANPGKPGYTSGPPNPYKETDSTPKRIDYIFLLPGDRHDIHIESCEVTMDQPVGGKVLSDHYGVKARLSIRARAQ
jgi:endonuclease/exonuclease/phosphatase family metal-dependent hydrolase